MHGNQAAPTAPDAPFLGEGDGEETTAGLQQQGFRKRARTAPASWFRANGGEAERLLSDQPAGVQGAEQPQNAIPRRTPGRGKGVRASASRMSQITEQKEPPTGAVHDAAAETVEITQDAQHGGDEELGTGKKKAPRFIEALCVKKVPLWFAATLVLICSSISIIASVLGTIYATNMPPCPEDDWIWSKGNCYYFSEDTTDWKSSQEFCSSKSSSLAILKDPVVLETSFRFKDSSRDYWIGLKKVRVTGHKEWRWVDGSPYRNEVDLVQSDGPDLDCVYLNSKKAWNLHCSSQRPWICVKESS